MKATTDRKFAKEEQMKVYSSENAIIINNPFRSKLAIEVFDTFGQVVLNTEIWEDGLQTVPFANRVGSYLVRVFVEEQVYTQEIAIV